LLEVPRTDPASRRRFDNVTTPASLLSDLEYWNICHSERGLEEVLEPVRQLAAAGSVDFNEGRDLLARDEGCARDELPDEEAAPTHHAAREVAGEIGILDDLRQGCPGKECARQPLLARRCVARGEAEHRWRRRDDRFRNHGSGDAATTPAASKG
jgi:hypothetical protein